MPVNLTLKGIPDEIYTRLKASAQTHRRSLNSEAIVCLESSLTPGNMPVAERLSRVRALRASLAPMTSSAEEIDRFKRQGRE